jgi:hypothetical protein
MNEFLEDAEHKPHAYSELLSIKLIETIDVPGSLRLITKLSKVVSEQALSSKDDVSLQFLIKYLANFYDIGREKILTDSGNKEGLTELLEEKLK